MDAIMSYNLIPTRNAFRAIQSASIKQLSQLTKQELRTILPCLSRAALCSTLDISDKFRLVMKEIRRIMAGIDAVTSIVSLLSIDFSTVREDAIKEQQLRRKMGGNSLTESYLTDPVDNTGILAEFERSEASRRIRLVLSQLLKLCTLVTESQYVKEDAIELFNCVVYLQEVSDILCICFSELSDLLPVKEVAEALLRVRFGPLLLCRLVGNAPDCFEQVCLCILSNSSTSDESNHDTKVRTKTLKMLCSMNPLYVRTLRSEAISKCKLPGLAIELSVSSEEMQSDLVPFLSGLLLTSDLRVKEWLAEYIKNAQKDAPNSSIHVLRNQLMKETLDVVKSFSRSEEEQDENMDVDAQVIGGDIPKGIALMRLYCALKGMVGYKISNEESEAFLKLITCHPPGTAGGVRFVCAGLSSLLACTFIISYPEREEKATQWIEWLCAHQAEFGHSAAVSSSFGEMLLLIAIHFHSNNLEAIVDLVTSTLSMKLRPGSLTKMKILFTQQLFPEKVAAEHVLTVPVTKNLNAHLSGFLPVHCVHQLLKSRVFSKHKVDVKDWVYSQICTASAPLHPLMVPLIEAFVHAIIQPIQIGKTGKHHKTANLDRFSEESLFNIFAKDRSDLSLTCETSSFLLMLFYTMLYQDCLLTNMATLLNDPKRPMEYSAALYNLMPIKQLLLTARENQHNYEDLYPPLLRLVSKSYPHLCLVEDYMFEEEVKEEKSVFLAEHESQLSLFNAQVCCNDQLRSVLKDADTAWPKTVLVLSKLVLLRPNQLVEYADALVDSFPFLLKSSVPRKVQSLCSAIWYKLNTVIPRRLWLRTVNALSQTQATGSKAQPYTDEEITKDPLVILRCDRRLFRCTPLFDVVLRILSAYMDASRAFLAHHLQSHPLPPVNRTIQSSSNSEIEREELKSALISAQESAIVQILLEMCLLTEEERKLSSTGIMCTIREIQCRVCCFLHQVFITDPNMVKLVHFQGYPPDLLSVTVAGVPSMHICLDFIPELLNMPQLEKQLFAVQLLSFLALQYPIPKCLSVAKHAVNRLTSLCAALPARTRRRFFLPVLPCLVRFSNAFPPLRQDATELLIILGNLAYTQLNKDTSASLRIRRLFGNPSVPCDEGVEDVALQNDELDSYSETNATGLLADDRLEDLGLRCDEKMFLQIEKTFREIAGASIISTMFFDEQRRS